MYNENELTQMKDVLQRLKKEGKIRLAILYGSYARGTPHVRSDIDLAVFVSAKDTEEEIEIIDKILMSAERDIYILRFDEEDKSPFVVQEDVKRIIIYHQGHKEYRETMKRNLENLFYG